MYDHYDIVNKEDVRTALTQWKNAANAVATIEPHQRD